MAVAASAQPSVADILAAGAKFGPNAGLAIQRSQYLANALQALQADSGSIRTPLGLGANLLADGITQWSKNKADKEAMTAYGVARMAQDNGILSGLQSPANANLPAAAPPQADPSVPPAAQDSPPPAVAPSPAVQIGGPPQAASTPTVSGGTPTPDQIKLAQMVWGEARGEPPAGQQAVAAVAINRLKKQPGASLADILDAPNQFEGLTPQARAQTPAKLASILANIAPEIAGADPTGGATNFLNPALQAMFGRQQPAWAQGPHQTIGHQDFYGGSPQAPGAPPQAPMPSAPTMGAQPPAPLPPQAPMFPQQPPPAPLPPAGAAPPPVPPSPGPQAGGAGPQVAPGPQGPVPMPQGAPTGPPPNPAEMDHLRGLLASPMTHDEGVAYGESLRRRMVTPIESPKDMVWSPQAGHFVPVPGKETTQLASASPSDVAQRDPFGAITHTAIPGVQGSVPEGSRYDVAQQGYVPIRGGQSTVSPGPIAGTYHVVSPGGDLKIVSDPNMTSPPPSGYDRNPTNPSQLIPQGVGGPGAPGGATNVPGKAPIPPALQETYLKMLNALHEGPGYKDFANSVNAANALETNLKAAAGNSGVISQAVTDNLIRAMTGLSARQGSVTSMLDHLPWSEQLKGFVQKAIGPQGANGFLTPTVLGQMRDAVHAYADGHQVLAQQEYDQANSGANRMGFDLGQTLPSVMPKTPIQWLDTPGAPAAPAPQANAAAQQLQALLAEKARRGAVGAPH